MNATFLARLAMGTSLGFHILFAVVGMSLPVLIVVAELRFQRTKDPVYEKLSYQWARGLAVLFAVGAVSGTVLSFELGLLWPGFMAMAGPAIGFLFALEGFAFFLEAIFLGIFLYGKDRVSPTLRLACGVGVALMGNLSAIFVTLVNGWMNHPVGAVFEEGQLIAHDPWLILTNPSGWQKVLHMVLAAWSAVAAFVAGIHAWELWRDRESRFHRVALEICLLVGIIPTLLMPVTGHLLAENAAHEQPAKLAAMEAHFQTERRASLWIGGIPNPDTQTVSYGIKLPGMLSLLATGSMDGEVKGLNSFPPEDRPPVRVPHFAFQIMVGCGSLLALLSILSLDRLRRGGEALKARWFLMAVVAAAPLGLIALEAGWIVTEVGRQPWVIYGVLRTQASVTPVAADPLGVRLLGFLTIYIVLGFTVIRFLRAYIQETRRLSGGTEE